MKLFGTLKEINGERGICIVQYCTKSVCTTRRGQCRKEANEVEELWFQLVRALARFTDPDSPSAMSFLSFWKPLFLRPGNGGSCSI